MATPKAQKRRLGRGLSSLVSNPVKIESPTESSNDGQLRSIPTTSIQPNPHQPRQQFRQNALEALAESIRTAGLMQPIVVRPNPDGGYLLVAGERRWRAAQIVGLEHIPAVVRDVEDKEAAEFALIENVQREDLNPMERAEAFARLANDFHMTHQEIADRVGLERSNVSNHMRLLELDEQFKEALRNRQISMGHARALLGITNIDARNALGLEAIAGGLSVRDVENRARKLANSAGETSGGAAPPKPQQLHMQDLQRQLGEHLGTKVELRKGKAKGSGQLIISFYSLDEFDGLLKRLGFDASSR